jgi:hypothetical protein
MKFNKWTLGLAAVGAVSLTSAARADETNFVQTTLASTMITGYVDTSIEWDPGTGDLNVPGYSYNAGKQDGFNLNSVVITIAKAEDESEWAAGYDIDLMIGPDNPLGLGGGFVSSSIPIRQAYVTLRTPVGNGIDWKLGVFDTIIGYESTVDPNNPNYSRSYGYSIEPTSHTGMTGTYKITDEVSVTAGMANTSVSAIDGRANPPKAESYKTYLASASFTAPTNWGAFSGSALYAGFINGWNSVAGQPQENLYFGTTVNTPVSGLTFGASYDYSELRSQPGISEAYANALDLYNTFAIPNTKFTLNTRGEYFWQSHASGSSGAVLGGQPDKILALTETVQYDLWKNVLTRLELRWDHQAGSMATGAPGGNAWGGNQTAPVGSLKRNWYDLVANVIYKF